MWPPAREFAAQTRAQVEDKMEIDKKSVEIPEVRALPRRPPTPTPRVLDLQKTKEAQNA